MISIYTVIVILFWHWFADFVLQTDEMAKNKSSNNSYLLKHTITYALSWFLLIWIIEIFQNVQFIPVIEFVGITFVAHTITDYITSRINSKLWTKGDTHYFFVSIGFDQFLHFTQLLLTYKLLF